MACPKNHFDEFNVEAGDGTGKRSKVMGHFFLGYNTGLAAKIDRRTMPAMKPSFETNLAAPPFDKGGSPALPPQSFSSLLLKTSGSLPVKTQ